jgi:hypothetical protein
MFISFQLAKRALLRCYLDMGYGREVREMLEVTFPEDTSACFAFAKVLLEFVAHFLLKEEDASLGSVERALERGNKQNWKDIS